MEDLEPEDNPLRITFEAQNNKERDEWIKVFDAYNRIIASGRKGGAVKLIIRDGKLKFSEMTVSTDLLHPEET